MDGNQDDDNEEDEEGDEGAAAPSSLPAPALIMGAAVTNFHVAGAAPQFAQGGEITLRSSRCVAFWALLWGLFRTS